MMSYRKSKSLQGQWDIMNKLNLLNFFFGKRTYCTFLVIFFNFIAFSFNHLLKNSVRFNGYKLTINRVTGERRCCSGLKFFLKRTFIILKYQYKLYLLPPQTMEEKYPGPTLDRVAINGR